MNQLKAIIMREYKERVRQKGFILTTALGLLVMIALSFAPALMDMIKNADQLKFTVLEQDEKVGQYLENSLQDTLPNGEKRIVINSVIKASPAEWDDKKADLIRQVNEEGIIFAEVFPPGAPESVIWHSKKVIGNSELGEVQAALQQMVVQERIQDSGISSDAIARLYAPINFQTEIEGQAEGGIKGETHEEQIQNIMLVYILLFMLYFALVIYGSYVAQGVIEEKSSRIMEMMLAAVKPTTMMAGKIIGIGAVGITQFAIWISVGLGLLSFKGGGMFESLGLTLSFEQVDPILFFYFGLFFILGFLMYAAIYAGLGSMVSRVEDAGQVVTPLTMLIVVAFMVAMFSLASPDNPWIVSLSHVPFFTPMLLFTRIVLTHVSPLSIVIGVGEMVLTIVILIWLAAKIYRAGVLMYGKVSFKDAFRILRKQ